MSSKTGKNVFLDGFRLFGSQTGNPSASPALFSFPDRHTVEESLKSYFGSPWRIVYPIIDPVLIQDILAVAFDDSQGPSPQGKASSQACILAFMAMTSQLRGAHVQPLDGDVYVRSSQCYLSQVISQSTMETLQTVLMLVS